MVRYSFPVRLLHSLLHAGLSRRIERNPVGSYRREFDVPANWNGRRIFLTFDGVDSAFFLWINGENAGFSVNSRNAAEFDVTRYVKPGKNMIAVEVYRFSAGTYLEDQDMWRLSGIFRNVTLWSAPPVHMRDFFIQTDLDAQYRDAILDIAAKVHNYSDQPAAARKLTVDLFTREGRPVTGATASVAVPALNPGEERNVSVAIHVSNPAKWTAEAPNLYTTMLTLSGRNSAEQEIISARTGFRKIEIKGPIFMINGVAVKLKGANRHEMWPDTGHYVSDQQMIRDLELLKQVNANHVRTSHYSDDPRWYGAMSTASTWLPKQTSSVTATWEFSTASRAGKKPSWIGTRPTWRISRITLR